MVRAKGVLNMMMMSVVTMGVVGVAWVLFGFSEAFGDSWHVWSATPPSTRGCAGCSTPSSAPTPTT